MSHPSNRRENRSPEDNRARKIKLAEGGILFVLVLSTCVYLGLRFAHEPIDESTAATASYGLHGQTTALGGNGPVDVTAAPAAVEPQPVAVQAVESPRQPLDIREVLPEVPIYVTYSSAEKAYFEGRYTEAAEMFAEYSDRHPANTWGHYMRGLALWKAGRPGDARGALESALGLDPEHLKSLVNLARVELELAEYDAAMVAIERALDIAPHHVEALRVLGRIYHQLDRPDTAAATYMQALRLKADDAWTLNNLALVYIEREQFDRALPALARACELAPSVAVIRNNLGTALERTGHAKQALAEYEQALLLGSQHGEDNFVRLDAVILRVDEPAADLSALAASWSLPAAGSAAVAVVSPGNEPHGDR